nr:unnamed protein product [Callosobruchus chinensis]
MYSDLNLLRELRTCEPTDFQNYLRMDSSTFDELLELVTPFMRKEDTIMRQSISHEERLVATLSYLATGRSYECLKFSTGISPQSLGRIIPETCKGISDRSDFSI